MSELQPLDLDLDMDAAPHALPATLIHDLRTPLNQIIGYAEMLTEQAQEAGAQPFAADLQKIRAAGQQLLTLINNNFHSLGTSEAPVSAAPTDSAIATANSQAVSPQIPNPNSQPVATQGFLLVVDDNETNRDVLSRRLERQGYAVATAEDGRQALAMLDADAFDMVLLDIMMPEMDGYEVLQRLKADERQQHIPVIMISALEELDSVVRCIEMGAEDYLPKPFNPILLKARIGACLEKKRAHDRERQLFAQLQDNYKRLQELEKLRDDLTNMIVHDLRTPLTSIIAGIQTVEIAGQVNASQREVLSIVSTGSQSLLGMINDLLDVEKSEASTMQLDNSEFHPGELAASAIAQVAALSERKQVELVRQIPDELTTMRGDESKLRRTLVNLLGNAIKFTPSGGTVTIGAQQSSDGQAVEFCVSDTGEGIPAGASERIFEKFGQVESRQGGRTMSTGLGLTFCKLAVEAHGGQINFTSTLGHGSTFRFTIPQSAPAQSAPAQSAPAQSAPAQSAPAQSAPALSGARIGDPR